MFSTKKIIVLAGPSGAGKTTLFDRLYEEYEHKISNSFKLDIWISNLYNSNPFLKNLIEYLFGDLYENSRINKDKLFDCYLKYPDRLTLVRHYIDYEFYRRVVSISGYNETFDEGQDTILIEASNWFDFEICSKLFNSHVIWITADDSVRFKRLIERVGEEKAKKIFEIQYKHLTLPERDECGMFLCTDIASLDDTYSCMLKYIEELNK